MKKYVLKDLTIPVFILIRPRSGNFVYSKEEFSIMKEDIKICKELGCQGIVSGILNSDNTLNIKQTKELIELSNPMCFTFHRAFDDLKNPLSALSSLIELGAKRILSAGQKNTAVEGIEFLKKLVEFYARWDFDSLNEV